MLLRKCGNWALWGNIIIIMFGVCTLDVKRHIFRAPGSLVCCSYLSAFIVTSLRTLNVCYNDFLRQLLGEPRWNSASAMSVHLRRDNIIVLLWKLSFGLNIRLKSSDNVCVKGVRWTYSFIKSDLTARWRNTLKNRR